jgi:hypothetical protein
MKTIQSDRIKKVLIVLPLALFLVFTLGTIFQEYSQKEKTDIPLMKEKVTEVDTLEEEGGPADTVKIGAYIFSVYDLDFPGNKVNVDLYLWYNSENDSINMLEYLELINSSWYSKTAETNEKRGNSVYQTVRINSTIKQEWDVTHFPFDKQKIEIHIEDYDKDNSKLVLVADTLASKIDKDVKIEGWKIKDFGIKTVDHTYETNYGDPEIPIDGYSEYSRAIVYFTIEREGNGLFFKLFIGLFISVLISLLTFFVNPLDLDPRFGLSVGAIFAAIASQYVITSTLPQNESLTLVDILHDISFIYIFMCILVSTISLHLVKTNRLDKSKKLDRYSFFICSVTYLVLIVIFVIRTFD